MQAAAPTSQNDEATDRVSVWIGMFPDEATFDAYFAETMDEDDAVTCPFWQDFGIGQTDSDFQEVEFRSAAAEPAALFDGFSWADTYRDAVAQACRERGITQANAVALLFEYAYAADAPSRSPYLTYLGAFTYGTGGTPFRRN